MTNAPFILNVDCDMFVNNPQVFRHAMCQLLGSKNERETAFVQYPQVFYDGLRDDPYGNQFVVPYQVIKFSFRVNLRLMQSLFPFLFHLLNLLQFLVYVPRNSWNPRTFLWGNRLFS